MRRRAARPQVGAAAHARILGVEVVGGRLANGVALLSDSAHMFTDVIALGLGLFGVWIADQPATDRKTYGYYRAEILVALTGHCALSAHAVVEDGASGDEVLAEMSDRLAERFDIRHVTIQLELRRRRYAEPVH